MKKTEEALLRNFIEMIRLSEGEALVTVSGIKGQPENVIRISITPNHQAQLNRLSALVTIDTQRLFAILRNNRKAEYADMKWIRFAFQKLPGKMIEVLIADDFNELLNMAEELQDDPDLPEPAENLSLV